MTLLALAPVIALAFAPELDFTVLPPANTTAGYRYTVTIELAGKAPVEP